MKKRILLAFLAFLPLAHAIAEEVVIDGIKYNLVKESKEAEVKENSYLDEWGSPISYYSGDIVIPPTVENEDVIYSVTSIGYEAFYNCSSLTSVTIPESVISIDRIAFYYCSSLTSVSIPESVTSIGDDAFAYCGSLTSVTIPASVTSIGYYAFKGCSSLTSVNISDLGAWCKISFPDGGNPLNYAHHLFLNGEEIKDLVIPESVTSVGKSAFAGCSSLTSVTIPESVTSIGDRAFAYCSSLTSVTIPESVTSIGGGAFWYCI